MAEFKTILTFFICAEIISLLIVPLNFYLFKNLKDKGYAFSKTSSLLLIAYINFVLFAGGMGDKKKLCDILAFGLIIVISGLILLKNGRTILNFFKGRLGLILQMESLFLIVFIIATLIKMGHPHVYEHTEKFSDFHFFNRLIHEKSFPPQDTWLSGFPINYYYMGHFAFATLTRITGVPPEYGVNLSVILILAMTFTGVFSLIYNLKGKFWLGLISAISVSFLSHLDGFLQIISGPVGFDWWRSSRIIEGTINEFPYFAFLLGDLHAHFISLPFFILFLGLILSFGMTINGQNDNAPLGRAKDTRHIHLLAIALATGFILTINAWNFPVAMLLLFLVGLGTTRKQKFKYALAGSLSRCFLVAAAACFFFLPFILNYHSPMIGVGILPLSHTSNPLEFLIVFGFPLLFIIVHFSTLAYTENIKEFLVFILVASTLSLAIFLIRPAPVTAGLSFLLTIATYFIIKSKFRDALAIILAASIAILLGCELVYIKDNYTTEYLRMNTVFKFHWLSLAMLLMITPVLFSESLARLRRMPLKISLVLVFSFLVFASSIYAVMGTRQRNFPPYKPKYYRPLTLDGLRFMKKTRPGDFRALEWLKGNTEPDDVILEASGKPFSYYARFSTFSARPTVLGWGNHEMVWRPNAYPLTLERSQDIRRIYSAADKRKILPLIHKYGVKFIIVGSLEEQDYLQSALKGFKSIAKTVFEDTKATIYRVD